MAYRSSSSDSTSESKSDQAVEKGLDTMMLCYDQPRDLASKTIDAAIEHFENALLLSPNNLDALFHIGRARYIQVDFLDASEKQREAAQESTAILRSVLLEAEGHEPTETYLAKSLFRWAEHSDDPSEKIKHFEESINIADRIIKARLERGEVDSEEDMEFLADMNHFLGTAYELRAESESDGRKKWFELAIHYAAQSIEFQPNNVGARYGFARSLLEMAKSLSNENDRSQMLQRSLVAHEELIRDLPTFDKDDPFFEAHGDWTPKFVEFNYGCTLALLGKSDEAIDILLQIIDEGTIPIGKFETDSDLDPIRNEPRFQAMMSQRTV